MTALTWLKIVLAGLGLATFLYGYSVDDANIRWVGIALVAAAFLLRFVGRRRDPADR
ncbi:MAG TPA: hypothetical protein VNA89_12850 [Gemmatimonadaceae bacterium]|nr:hypothetical protein [Gemmatimonadaceae bacterium]